jgi:hypothetical protein
MGLIRYKNRNKLADFTDFTFAAVIVMMTLAAELHANQFSTIFPP